MHDRIKQLAEQADIVFGFHNNNEVICSAIDIEKFAELIVAECIEVVKWTPSIFPNDKYVKNIKEHFGVGE